MNDKIIHNVIVYVWALFDKEKVLFKSQVMNLKQIYSCLPALLL